MYVCIAILINLFYYAKIMQNAFKNLLCPKLYWHNRPGPNANVFIKKKNLYANCSIIPLGMGIMLSIMIYFLSTAQKL